MILERDSKILTDKFGRFHNYLRISLTELCNLRCTYCMPAEGISLTPRSHLMNAEEVFAIAREFVGFGVNKIRLTGGEPLVRKDIVPIMEQLSTLPVELTLTTNAVIADRFIDTFKNVGIQQLNVSLDSLDSASNSILTRRNYFRKVYNNLMLLVDEGFHVKVNCVLIKGFNDMEIPDFIRLGENSPLDIRFIEFMPFDGNQWNRKKLVSFREIINRAESAFGSESLIKLQDAPNDTTRSYRVDGYSGTFGIISSVTNPFCDGCNRLRLTADGKLKNCLFSAKETDLLNAFRNGENIAPIIQKAVLAKFKMRSGMDTMEKFSQAGAHSENRSMITIGG